MQLLYLHDPIYIALPTPLPRPIGRYGANRGPTIVLILA
jgi:hypothetical protein